MQCITNNIISRVLQMKFGSSTGTCFTVEHNDIQYLVTAKHMFENKQYPSNTTIQIYQKGLWKDLKVNVYYHNIEKIDIAVMKFDLTNITPRLPIEYTVDSVIIGQDMFFCGFPFGLRTEQYDLNCGYPISLVKKCSLSSIFNNDDVITLVLDGHNNQGFSGGPVVYDKVKYGEHNNMICGVISSYKCFLSPLFDKYGKETEFFIKENAGIIIAYDIKYAFEIIESISK